MQKTAQIYDEILDLAKKHGVIQIRDLRGQDIHPEYLRRLYNKGMLVKLARGQYALPEGNIGEHHSLVIVAKALPKGVFCMLTALRFHNIGTQAPHEVWVAIERRAAKPGIHKPKIRVFRFSGDAYTEGVEKHVVEGIDIHVYSPAKTIADCFKYRNKIGIDVAVEALHDGWQQKKFTMNELWKYAKVCRVANVMKPYLESLS
jgi:predicted transcriptional regulator of viral defense system